LTENFSEYRKRMLELLLREMESVDLLRIEEDFYEKTAKKLLHFKNFIESISDKNIREDMLRQFSSTERVLKILLLLRIKKALEEIMSKDTIDYSKLPRLEREILFQVLDKYDRFLRRFQRTLQGKQYPKKTGYRLVYFLKRYPKILASNGKSYGPFRENDLALLPLADANYLEKRGIVKGVDS